MALSPCKAVAGVYRRLVTGTDAGAHCPLTVLTLSNLLNSVPQFQIL